MRRTPQSGVKALSREETQIEDDHACKKQHLPVLKLVNGKSSGLTSRR